MRRDLPKHDGPVQTDKGEEVIRRAFSRRDSNHTEIVNGLRQRYVSVLDLSPLGDNAPDILVGYQGNNYLFEIKSMTGKRKPKPKKLLPGQEVFRLTWLGRKVVVAPDIETILIEIGWTAF
jgi:hypothetical protein